MNPVKITKSRMKYVEVLRNAGLTGVATTEQIKAATDFSKLPYPQWVKQLRVGRGKFDLSSLFEGEVATGAESDEEADDDALVAEAALADRTVSSPQALSAHSKENLVPARFPGYVPFGNFTDVKNIISSGYFYPVYITGLSGNGKTMMVEEVCAREKREMIRANITGETDEDDLLGGFRLIQGETVWQDGPVITAMKRGAILLLDEVDLGTPKLMCLQPVLEGKSIFLKKINTLVKPAPGFNIIATANTKGKGSDDGNFIGTMVMNEAFLERFAVTMEQEYPNKSTEMKILGKEFSKHNMEVDDHFIDCLTTWSKNIRDQYVKGGVTDMISTRRLVHIVMAFNIFKDRLKALTLGLNRFTPETKGMFLDLYKKYDAEITAENERKNNPQAAEAPKAEPETASADDFPF